MKRATLTSLARLFTLSIAKLSIASLCAASLCAASLSVAADARLRLVVVDANGKIIGEPFGNGIVAVSVPDDQVVAVGYGRTDFGSPLDYQYFYPFAACSGTAYLPASTIPIFGRASTKEGVLGYANSAERTAVRIYSMSVVRENGRQCSEVNPPHTILAAPAKTIPISFNPPFDLKYDDRPGDIPLAERALAVCRTTENGSYEWLF